MFVFAHDDRRAFALGNRHGNQLVLEGQTVDGTFFTGRDGVTFKPVSFDTSVVAHEETAVPEQSITLDSTLPGTPAPELRARADDGVRSFLMPAAEPEIVAESESTADQARTSSS